MSAIINAILGSEKIGIEPIAFSTDIHNCSDDRSLVESEHLIGVDGTLTGVEVEILTGGSSVTRNVYCKCVIEDEHNIERGTLFKGYLDGNSVPNGYGAKPVRSTWYLKLKSWSGISGVTLKLRGTYLTKKKQAGGWTGTNEGNLDGKGNVRLVIGSLPGALVSQETVPSGCAMWKIYRTAIQLSCSTLSGSRNLGTLYENDDNESFALKYMGTAQTAGQNLHHFIGTYTSDQSSQFASALYWSFPFPMDMRQGWVMKHAVTPDDKNDTLYKPRIHCEEWLEASES